MTELREFRREQRRVTASRSRTSGCLDVPLTGRCHTLGIASPAGGDLPQSERPPGSHWGDVSRRYTGRSISRAGDQPAQNERPLVPQSPSWGSFARRQGESTQIMKQWPRLRAGPLLLLPRPAGTRVLFLRPPADPISDVRRPSVVISCSPLSVCSDDCFSISHRFESFADICSHVVVTEVMGIPSTSPGCGVGASAWPQQPPVLVALKKSHTQDCQTASARPPCRCRTHPVRGCSCASVP